MNMKELSIKEKAKAYDEALSVAQETYTTQPMYREWLAKMFPELKESEDDRIRKEILAFIKRKKSLGSVNSEELGKSNSWIAWLEKQGEQKPQRMVPAEAKEAMYDKPAWSEEDERMISAFNALIEDVQKEHGRDCVYYDDQEVFHKDMQVWLKSLRPQSAWKPSEEQLGALANALGLANNCGEESAFDLRTLHKQLKKLKE